MIHDMIIIWSISVYICRTLAQYRLDFHKLNVSTIYIFCGFQYYKELGGHLYLFKLWYFIIYKKHFCFVSCKNIIYIHNIFSIYIHWVIINVINIKIFNNTYLCLMILSNLFKIILQPSTICSLCSYTKYNNSIDCNMRSKCRCSCVLQFTRWRTVCCVLHRPMSQVILRLECLLFFIFIYTCPCKCVFVSKIFHFVIYIYFY